MSIPALLRPSPQRESVSDRQRTARARRQLLNACNVEPMLVATTPDADLPELIRSQVHALMLVPDAESPVRRAAVGAGVHPDAAATADLGELALVTCAVAAPAYDPAEDPETPDERASTLYALARWRGEDPDLVSPGLGGDGFSPWDGAA